MTIALTIKINEGLVIAADSASTLSIQSQDGNQQIQNVYDNANKIVNLHKGLPLVAMTWGNGEIDGKSISTIFKDLRKRFEGRDKNYPTWKIDLENYTISDIADRVCKYIFEELISKSPNKNNLMENFLGIYIGGFSSDGQTSDSYILNIHGNQYVTPKQVLTESGAIWNGQPEAISRLLLGYSSNIVQALRNLGVSDSDSLIYSQQLIDQTQINLVTPGMPIQDAIDLARFLVDTSIKFTRFRPGGNTVGGPVEIAAITQHEGFKWVDRKLYYPVELNK